MKVLLLILISLPVMAEELIVVLYLQDTVMNNGEQVLGYADMSGPIPVIKVNKEHYKCTVVHELKHVLEGGWHGTHDNDQCD